MADERRDALAHLFNPIAFEDGWLSEGRRAAAQAEAYRQVDVLLASDAFAEVIRAERAAALREAALDIGIRVPYCGTATGAAKAWLRARADREAQR